MQPTSEFQLGLAHQAAQRLLHARDILWSEMSHFSMVHHKCWHTKNTPQTTLQAVVKVYQQSHMSNVHVQVNI